MNHVAYRMKRNQALQERDRLAGPWRDWRREHVKELLAGPYAEAARQLMDLLQHMQSPTELIDYIKDGPWRTADADMRFLVLTLIDSAIIKLREKHGMPPFDDPLPDQKPNVFLLIKQWLCRE